MKIFWKPEHQILHFLLYFQIHRSQCMRFPTIYYVRPAKPQISLRIRASWSEPLLVAWIFYDLTPFGVSKLKRRLHRLTRVHTCQNVKLLEISFRGSNLLVFQRSYHRGMESLVASGINILNIIFRFYSEELSPHLLQSFICFLHFYHVYYMFISTWVWFAVLWDVILTHIVCQNWP